jgi:hypothetical protein
VIATVSKHTMGAYQELCRWVGTRFKATLSGDTGATGVSGHLAEVAKVEELEQSYVVLEQSYGVLEQTHGLLEQRYGVLEQEHSRISEESENRRAQAEESLRLRLSAEDELRPVPLIEICTSSWKLCKALSRHSRSVVPTRCADWTMLSRQWKL